MILNTTNYNNDRFTNYFLVAIIIHIVAFLCLYISHNIKLFNNPPEKVELIKSSVRVDVVAMPKFTVQELKKMKLVPMSNKKEIEKNQKLKKEKIIEEKVKAATKKVNLNSLFGNLSKKDVVDKKNNSKSKTGTKKYQKELNKLILEGNKLSKGSSTTGSSDYSKSQEFISYVQALPSIVRPYWKLPSYLLDKGLRCRIQVFISKRGEVLNFKVYESSGDAEFDQRAIDALKKVKRFPDPKNEIALRVASGEVILGFPI